MIALFSDILTPFNKVLNKRHIKLKSLLYSINLIQIISINIQYKNYKKAYRSAPLNNLLPAQQMQSQPQQQQQQTQPQVESLKVFFHLISQDQKDLETHLVDVEKSLTLEECTTILSDKLKKVLNHPQYRLTLTGQIIDQHSLISKILQTDDADLFVFYEGIKPIVKQKQKELHFDSLTKYSFLDENKFVKVYVPLQGIGKHPDDKIHARFLDRSFQVKILDFKGKNWIFAVPKTQCQILIKESKVIKKDEKLIVKLGKIAEGDNWFSLYKTRCVGEKQLD